MKFYAVHQGRIPGVYLTWKDCQLQVQGFPGAKFKSFPTRQEAEAFVTGEAVPASERTSPDFHPDDPTLAHIWVDGSCVTDGEGILRLGWAFLIIRGGQEIHRDSGNEIPLEAHRHRNVAGEIMAVLQALAWCQEHSIRSAKIYFDYQGLESWATGSWKTNTPFTQAYADAIKNSGMQLTWKKVLAHSGEANNEIVDQLARAAAQAAK